MPKLNLFFWGMLGACGALVFQIIAFLIFSFFLDPVDKLTFADFFSIPLFISVAALIEEFFKYLMLAKKTTSPSSATTILCDAIFLGAGFFALEFALISSSQSLINFSTIAEIALLQLGTSVLMNFFLAFRDFHPQKYLGLVGLSLASIFHFSYNLVLIKNEPLLGNLTFGVLVALITLDIALFSYLKKSLAQD